ncbi:STAS domain-containing protein [Streptomyces sp. NPDC095817]|uniref:STAS domain-containing protein n=1 Tax=Streptomyces sp. NPDC095817 TaxID=3155082 RepID=UPI00331AB22B
MGEAMFNWGNGRATVVLEGEIDWHTVPGVRDALAASGSHSGLDVDLSAVNFCDASGLNVFLEAAKRSADAAGDLRLHRPCRAVRRLVDVTGTGFLLADENSPLALPVDVRWPVAPHDQ